MRTRLRTGAWVVGGACLAACAAEASIGADACPRGATCKVAPLALPQRSSDVHSTGPALAPAWKASMLELEGNVVTQVDQHSQIAMGPAGHLWVFTPGIAQFQVTLLDLAGQVLEHATVEPPPEAHVRHDTVANLRAPVASHPRGPVVGVGWGVPCPVSISDNPNGCATVMSELFVFGSSAEPESRGSPYQINAQVDSFETVHRSADGDAVFITSMIGGLKKVDLESNILWEDDLSLDQFDQLPNGTTRQSSVFPFRSGAASPDGGLVFGIDILLKKSERWDWRYFAGGVLNIAADGGKSARLYATANGQSAWSAAESQPFDQVAVGELTDGHSHVALAYDTQQRLLAVYQQLDGDLAVLRMTGDEVESYRIMREDYADLRLYDVSVDPTGTLYISTQGGGREPGSEVPLLCRVPEQGSPDCVSIPEPTYDIEAAAPGVVYALVTGFENALVRFDFE